jgi:PadR family transcriptional regulator PadR
VDLKRELLKGNTPTLVLAVLRDGPRHGYGIAREIERRGGGALAFKEGTLYPVLHTLEREGLIAGEWQQEPGGRMRRVYVVTPAGLAALDQRARTWEEFAAAVHRVLGGEGHVGTGEGSTRTGGAVPGRTPGLEPAG